MNNENNRDKVGALPAFILFHANAKGTGSAVSFFVQPAELAVEGFVHLRIALQSSLPDAAHGGLASFDWDNALCVSIPPVAVAEMLMVFGGNNSVLVHAGVEGFRFVQPDALMTVQLARATDPTRPGFNLAVSSVPHDDPNKRRYIAFLLWPAEAFALREALRCKMGELAFGVKPATLSFGPVNPKEA